MKHRPDATPATDDPNIAAFVGQTRPDDRTVEVVNDLLGAWDDLWDDELHATHNPACCILATRVTIAVLDAHGIKAWPVPTETDVFNQAAAQLVGARVPIDEWPEHAWSIHAGHGSPGTGYPGHLWAGTDGLMIDLSARQFNRPGRLAFDGAMVLPLELHGPDPVMCEREDGTLLFVRRTGDRSYRRANDWTRNWQTVTARVLDRMAVNA